MPEMWKDAGALDVRRQWQIDHECAGHVRPPDESFWSQILGQAVEGELAGTELTPIASLQTTWKQWRALYPETLALRKGYSSANDPYNSYYASGQAGVIGETFEDDRLDTKTMGIGFVINDQPAYFPISALREEKIANDQVAGVPVLVAYRTKPSLAWPSTAPSMTRP